MANKEIAPPFIPRLKNDYDSRYFCEYPSSIEINKKMQERAKEMSKSSSPVSKKDEDIFVAF